MCATQESYIPTNGLCNMHTLPSMHMVSRIWRLWSTSISSHAFLDSTTGRDACCFPKH